MTTSDLHKWAREKRADLIVKHAKPGTIVCYAGSEWEVAHVKQFPHGPMIGIYDEPPSKHVDYLQPGSVTIPLKPSEGKVYHENGLITLGGEPVGFHDTLETAGVLTEKQAARLNRFLDGHARQPQPGEG